MLKAFKERPVLLTAISVSLLVELILMVLVYHADGGQRLPIQIARFIFQLILIALILFKESKVALFILAGYHILNCLMFVYSNIQLGFMGVFIPYHAITGLAIYFHEWIESKLRI